VGKGAIWRLHKINKATTAAMRRVIELEPRVAMVYANSAKGGCVNIFPSGLIINPIVRGLYAALTERCMIFELPLMEATHLGY